MERVRLAFRAIGFLIELLIPMELWYSFWCLMGFHRMQWRLDLAGNEHYACIFCPYTEFPKPQHTQNKGTK